MRAELLFGGIVDSILTGRIRATEASIERTREQLRSLDVRSRISTDAIRDAARERSVLAAERAAHGTTNRWITSLLDQSEFSLDREAARIATSEAVDAYAFARDEYVRKLPADVSEAMVKIWQSAGDKRTCPVCDSLDGETVPVKKPFSRGEPPVHASCRCSYYLDYL